MAQGEPKGSELPGDERLDALIARADELMDRMKVVLERILGGAVSDVLRRGDDAVTDDEVLADTGDSGFELIERFSAGQWAVGWARGDDDRWPCFLEEHQAIKWDAHEPVERRPGIPPAEPICKRFVSELHAVRMHRGRRCTEEEAAS